MSLLRIAVAFLAVAATALPDPGIAPAPAYKVVIHVDNPGNAVSRAVLPDIFLKKVEYWGNDEPIDVVEHSVESEIRAEFSREVLEMDRGAVMDYWRRMIRSERVRPPSVKASDAEVLEYVASHPNAIGYVSPGTATGAGVKVLQLID
jgi:ABC-type phosphate transport system substrate-binding protein